MLTYQILALIWRFVCHSEIKTMKAFNQLVLKAISLRIISSINFYGGSQSLLSSLIDYSLYSSCWSTTVQDLDRSAPPFRSQRPQLPNWILLQFLNQTIGMRAIVQNFGHWWGECEGCLQLIICVACPLSLERELTKNLCWLQEHRWIWVPQSNFESSWQKMSGFLRRSLLLCRSVAGNDFRPGLHYLRH